MTYLDEKHVVFGQVVKGEEVVQQARDSLAQIKQQVKPIALFSLADM